MVNLHLSTGSLFANRFEIERAAGSGGMGQVYRAKDRYSGDIVALKLLHSVSGGPEQDERFAREAQLLSELRHPGIVGHVAHGQTPDGQRFLAMEWLEGQDLGERLARGPLTVGACLRLLTQVADALSVAHQRGIIHRDLKPTNLFLMGGDVHHVKILDFGIARRINIGALQAMTRTGMVIGTPEYMAPEQARGSRDLTPAVDLFSLGCVLYECLTGQPPFVADHIAAVLVRILFEHPVPIEERCPGLPESLAVLLSRLLAKEPTRRLEDAEALAAELARLGELPEPALAVTIANPKQKVVSFADHEQSLVCIVLAVPEEEIGLDATQPGSVVQLASMDRQALLQSLARIGGSPDFLANGTLVVTVLPLDSAQDQATVAARAALLIKERWPEATVSMATGRGAIAGRTAVGEVVELAARSLKNRNYPSDGKPTTGVLLDPLSAKLLVGRFMQTPLPSGALLIAEEKEADASRLLLGKPTPCVGRDMELSILDTRLCTCIEDGEAAAILVTGLPGSGKSRLRHEFLRRLGQRDSQWTLLAGKGELMEAGAAYGILGQALRQLCSLHGSEPAEIQRERLMARLGQHVPAAERDQLIVFLAEMAGVPFPPEQSPVLRAARQDPKLMNEQIRRSFVNWLEAECQVAPVLIVLDDLQWGDALTVAGLDLALQELRGAPLSIVALARPEVRIVFPRLWSGHKVHELSLKGLSNRACERLVVQVLGKTTPPEVMAHLIEHSGGNALYLEELIRAQAEGNVAAIPETVLAMLQARIGRLPVELRQTLRAASILGQTFWKGAVAAILGSNSDGVDLTRALQELIAVEFIERHADSRYPNEIQYGFRHSLMCDAAYSLLTDENRKRGHYLAALYLENISGVSAAVLAEYFHSGGQPARAIPYFVQAANEALALCDLDGAQRLAERGMACGASDEALGILHSVQAWVATWNDRWDTAYEHGYQATALLPRGSRHWCKVMASMLVVCSVTRQEQFGVLIGDLFSVEPSSDARSAYADATSWLAVMFSTLCAAGPAQAALQRLEQISESAGKTELSIQALMKFGQILYFRFLHPNPYHNMLISREAVEALQETGELSKALLFMPIRDTALSEMGNRDEAERALRATVAQAQRARDTLIAVNAKLYLAMLLVDTPERSAADVAEAVALTREVLSVKAINPILLGMAHGALCRALWRQGELSGAEATARQAIAIMRMFPVLRLYASIVLIELLLHQGRVPDARAYADEELQCIEQLGCAGYNEVAFRLIVAEARYASGDADGARSALRAALAQLKLRADSIPDRETRERFLKNIPHNARLLERARAWLSAELD